MSEAVVIGGGVAGLAAALRLAEGRGNWAKQESGGTAGELGRQETVEGPSVTVLEAAERLGGKIVTERCDGFVIEGGPDSFLASKPRGVGLCEALGLGPRLHGTSPARHRSYVRREGRLYPLPEGLSGLVPAQLGPLFRSPLLSPLGKLRLAGDYIIPPARGEADEALASFVRRRLGREAYARLIEPLLGGIYAGDGERLSLRATFPQLRALERNHGSLLRGVRATRQAAPAPSQPARPAFLALAGGMGELVDALAGRLSDLGVCLRVAAAAKQVQAEPGGGYVVELAGGERLRARAVIVAGPAYAAAGLLRSLDPALAELLNGIEYVGSATVSLAYPVGALPWPLDGYGYVVPRAEGGPVLACTWASSKFPGRAPPGQALLRAFVGRAGHQAVLEGDDAALVGLARDEVRRTLGITATPSLQRVFRWPAALPQYNLGHLERLAGIQARLAHHPRLALAGAAYRGVGIPDCIRSGEEAAEKLLSTSP